VRTLSARRVSTDDDEAGETKIPLEPQPIYSREQGAKAEVPSRFARPIVPAEVLVQ
jgi:hypothetical protein